MFSIVCILKGPQSERESLCRVWDTVWGEKYFFLKRKASSSSSLQGWFSFIPCIHQQLYESNRVKETTTLYKCWTLFKWLIKIPLSPSPLAFKSQIIALYDLSQTLRLFKIWNLSGDFIHLLGSMEAPQQFCTSFKQDYSAFLSAGSGITWQFIWRWNQMKIPSVSPVLCNWIRLKYVASAGVAISIDSSYPVLSHKSLIRMRTSLVCQVKCQAFYCCIEENTLERCSPRCRCLILTCFDMNTQEEVLPAPSAALLWPFPP